MYSILVSQVYQVIHEGGIKAAKRTNLARLGLGSKEIHRVFGRFVKELYILSQMHSDRCCLFLSTRRKIASDLNLKTRRLTSLDETRP